MCKDLQRGLSSSVGTEINILCSDKKKTVGGAFSVVVPDFKAFLE